MLSANPDDRPGQSVRRPQKKEKKPTKKHNRFKGMLGFFLAFFIWFAIGTGCILLWFAYDLPGIERLENSPRRPGVTLLARDGSMVATYGDLYGRFIPIDQMPPHVAQAFVAAEDRRFFDHFGLDVIGIARAAFANYRAKSVVQGGSTITQQLAKNFLLSEKLYSPSDRSYRRKIQEILLALWLEVTFSKKQILSMYLNRVYFGSGVYGIDGAAHKYFGKGTDRLTIYESALLAGLLKAPSKYSPHSNPVLAHQRTQTVLALMHDLHFIDGKTYQKSKGSIEAIDHVYDGSVFGRYFADWVFDSIHEFIGQPEEDIVVTTTLDPLLQKAAEEKTTLLFEIEGPQYGAHQMALVAMTPDGGVRAMIGGADYRSSQFNRAVQAKRQTGSTFKLFVFLSALEHGYRATSPVSDAPLRIGKWQAKNYHWQSRGELSLTDAFAYSVNASTIRLAHEMGIGRLQEIALRLGLTSPQPKDLTLALGSGVASLLELTSAYSVIANHGFSLWPYGITSIKTSGGRILYRRQKTSPRRIVEPQATLDMLTLLRASLTYGTGKSAQFGRPIAGKTGTSQQYKDAWIVGFTPDLVTGVWVGNDQNTSMKKVTGGKLPARLWKSFMETVHREKPVRPFPHKQ